MSYRSLTFFTAVSLAAHTALLGGWPDAHPPAASPTTCSIEVGLVTLPRLEQTFSRQMLNAASPSAASADSPPAAAPPRQPESKQQTKTARPPVSPNPEPEFSEVGSEPSTDVSVLAMTEQPRTTAPDQETGSDPTVATLAAPLYAVNPAPAYPDEALRYGWEGEVWLRVDISPSGAVVAIEVERSSTFKVLDQAALRTVRGWQFEPARVGSMPVAGSVRVPIRFQIDRS